jgi:hypothetical protein
VSKIAGESEPELENWETGNYETGEPILVPVAKTKQKKQKKPRTSVLVPGLWHHVITGKPEPGVYIYKIIYIYIKLVKKKKKLITELG